MSETLRMESPQKIVHEIAQEAKSASFTLAQTPIQKINAALTQLADQLRSKASYLLEENQKDLSLARQNGLTDAMIDRLALNEERIEGMAKGVEVVVALDDPTGKVLWSQDRPNGLRIERVSCPIGVLGMIYESRPNVTVDASILCLKSHNAVVLRGGSESLNSSLALHSIIQDVLENNGIPKAAVSMIPIRDRDAVGEMLRSSDYIDVMIPRGGKGLIERVMKDARMPVFSHLDGLCHIYIHPSVKEDIAVSVALNAKMRRTGICGAMETLLLDKALDRSIAEKVVKTIIDAGCEIVGDEESQNLDTRIGRATPEDWITEYLEAKLSCKFVDGVEEAVSHINNNGSHHTDSILAEDATAVEYFQKNVDSGIVMHNASTQFADGGEFGMGAEIGIATGKMHARGPVGLEQLCTYKYLVHGTGQTRP